MSFDLYKGRVAGTAGAESDSFELPSRPADTTVRKLVAIGDLLWIVLVLLFVLGVSPHVIKVAAIGNLVFIAIRAAVLFNSSGPQRLSLGIDSRKETP
jgi:hypothetical protein